MACQHHTVLHRICDTGKLILSDWRSFSPMGRISAASGEGLLLPRDSTHAVLTDWVLQWVTGSGEDTALGQVQCLL